MEFIQGGPHRVALNRVTGNELSEIFGQLKSDGRLFLVNPAGIVFGEGAQVNVGALVASVLDIDNAAFWGGADAYTFTRGGGGGESPYDIHVEPGATLSAGDREDGGFIVLLGPKIMNEGTIIGQLGTVALGAGDQVTVELLGGGTVELEIQQRSDDARVVQTDTGQLLAEGGDVLILLDTVSSAVLLKGIVEATGIDNEGGRIVLRVDGLAAAETLWVIVHGDEADLTLAESVSAGGENDYVLVLAAGNRFLNEAGPDAITIDADNGGMYLVFSKDHKTSDLGEMASPGNLFASDYARVGVEQAVADIKRGYGLTLGSRFVYANAPTIIIAIEDKERLYGDGNPEFTFIREGLVSGDRWEDVLAEGTLTTAADATSPVGTYAITADGFEALLGYRLDIIGGTLTITPRPITVTADSYSKMQGEPDPELTYRITAGSLVRGDQLQGRLTREPGERPGEYAILQGTLGHRNYEIRFVPGTLTITLRPDARGAIPPADPFPEAPAAPAGGAGGGAAGSTCNGGVGGGAAGGLDDTRADLPMGVECDLPDDAQTGTSGTGQGMPYDGGAARR